MIRTLQLSVLLGLALVIANDSHANGPKNGGSSNLTRSSSGTSHNNSHVHYFTSQHFHCSSWRWNSVYSCYDYFCPSVGCYYYWYAPACCYYPVSCIAQFPPTPVSYSPSGPSTPPLPITAPQVQVTTPIQITNTNQNTLANNNGTPGIVAPVGPLPGPGPMPRVQ